MEITKDFVIPLAIALVTAVVTAVLTIQIQYSSSKKEALGGIKSFGSAALYYVWIAYLVFSLFNSVTSKDPITRPAVFQISVLIASLALLLMLHVIKRILSIMKSQLQLHDRHFDLFERHLRECHHDDADQSRVRQREGSTTTINMDA